jgi:quercetin dioxygenase-like cupin family protein
MQPRIAASFCLLTALLSAQTTAPAVVAITNEPSHHLALENEYVRVFKVEVAPHAATLMHRHDKDYVFVTLGDSELSNERQGEKPITLQLKDGETRFTRGGFAHIARNLSDKSFRNVTIELPPSTTFVCGAGQGVCSGAAGGVTGSGNWNWGEIVESDRYIVRRITVARNGAVPKHQHKGPHLAVAISDLHLRSEIEGKQPVEINQNAGDIQWIRGGFTHSVTNVGNEPARFVTIEFK